MTDPTKPPEFISAMAHADGPEVVIDLTRPPVGDTVTFTFERK